MLALDETVPAEAELAGFARELLGGDQCHSHREQVAVHLELVAAAAVQHAVRRLQFVGQLRGYSVVHVFE